MTICINGFFKSERGQDQNWLPQPCLIGGPKVGGNATSPLHCQGSPTKGTKSKRAQKRAEMLHHPCILGGPQQRGQNQSGPKRGRKCYITPAFSGVPNAKRGEKIRSGYLTPAFSGVPNTKRGEKIRSGYLTRAFSGVPNKGDKIKVGPKEGGNATSPLHSRGSPTPSAGRKSEVATSPLPSRGSPTKGTKSKRAQKRAEMLHHPRILGGPQTNGDKIRIGCLNPAFWGTHKWAEMLRQPCFLRDTQQRGQKQSTKKTKKQKQKISHGVLDPAYSPADCPHWGLNPGPFSCRGTALPTRCLVSWCLVSECLEPIPPDAPDTAAPARLGWTSPHRGGRSVHRVALVSPTFPPPLPWVPADTIRMGTRPMPSVLPKVIYSAWTHAQCPQFCQK